MYQRILIPTDGSVFSERAIRHGVDLAKAVGADVVAIHVVQPLHIGTPRALIPADLAATVRDQLHKIAEENLAAVEKAAREAGVAVDTVRERGDHPWEAILQTANQKGCDLIVMASHGRHGLGAMVLGSETQKVLTHPTIPVLVVR